jgi:Ca-activated chloride channel family protein
VLTDVQISFDMEGFGGERGSPVSRVYPRNVYDLFAGEQLVLAGRYREGGAARVRLVGKVGNERREFQFPVSFASSSHDETHSYVEKLWAVRRVGEIIDEIDLKGKNQELVNELVELAKRHGIVTPYTSFLADETQSVHDVAGLRVRAGDALERLAEHEGRGGFEQRDIKLSLQQAGAADGSVPGAAGARPTRMNMLNRFAGSAADQDAAAAKMLQVGRKTFLLRDGKWIDSAITDEQQKAAKKIERFGPEYFTLLRQLSRDAQRYLAIDGEVTVVIDGQAYSY